MDVLVSQRSKERYGERILEVLGGGMLLTPERGTVLDPQIAWLSTDLLYDDSARTFYGICASAPSLRWLQSPAAGIDFPLYRPLLERGVRVTGSHENSISIAEYVVGSVLRAYQRPEHWADAQRRRAWEHRDFPEVMGTTWLIVGYGAIGQAVAQRVAGFGAHVIGVRRSRGPAPFADEMIEPAELPTRLGDAEVVVLCRPGSSDGRALLDGALLARVRPGTTLVNVGRGNLIDDAALLDALDAGTVATAILDVFDPEPLPDESPLWDHPSVVITPHASAGGLGRYDRTAELFMANLARFIAGEPLPDEVMLGDLPEVAATPAQFQDPTTL